MPAENTDSLAHAEGERCAHLFVNVRDETTCAKGCGLTYGGYHDERFAPPPAPPETGEAEGGALARIKAWAEAEKEECLARRDKQRMGSPMAMSFEDRARVISSVIRTIEYEQREMLRPVPPCPETGEREADPRFTPYRAYSEELAEVVRDYLAVTGEGGFDGTPRRRMRAKLDALIGTDDQAGWNARFHAVCDREWAAAVVERVAEEEAARTTEGETA